VIVNLQRKIPLSVSHFRKVVENIRNNVPEASGADFAVAFVSDRRMRELNSYFRKKDSTTDVLSFPHIPDGFETQGTFSEAAADGENRVFLGDIVISAEQAQRQAEHAGHSLVREIEQLILHGVLHLCGYDHETDNGEMNRRELELRRILDIE